MRTRPFALLSGLLAAAALTAAKPGPPDEPAEGAAAEMTRQSWRGEAIAACVTELHALPALSPDNLESICGCAASRFLQGRGGAALPAIEQGQLPPMMQGQLIACTTNVRPEQASAVARLLAGATRPPPPVADVPPGGAKPVDEADAGPVAERDTGNGGGGFRDWLSSLRLPDWLTGASVLWWIAIGIFVFGLLILKVRRRDTRRDLTGPPPSMRRGAPPQPPRRPDLPR